MTCQARRFICYISMLNVWSFYGYVAKQKMLSLWCNIHGLVEVEMSNTVNFFTRQVDHKCLLLTAFIMPDLDLQQSQQPPVLLVVEKKKKS